MYAAWQQAVRHPGWRRTLIRTAALLLWLIAATALQAAPNALFRRDVTVADQGRGNDRIAVHLVFFLPDVCHGFRLTDAAGNERGAELLDAAGSRREILFNARPGEKLTLNYYREPVRPRYETPVGGLVRESYAYDGSRVDRIDDFNRLRSKARKLGARLEKKVYSACNPFGDNRSLQVFRGAIRIVQPGEYHFYTASTDASFLLIDGKVIAAWPGWHWVGEGLYGKHGGTVRLEPGVHRFEYLQANNNGGVCYSIAAYRLPGKDKFQYLPEAMFVPAVEAGVGELRNDVGARVSDPQWRVTDTMEVDGRWMFRLSFDAPGAESGRWVIDGHRMDGNGAVWQVFDERPFRVRFEENGAAATRIVQARRRYEMKVMPAAKEHELLRELLRREERFGLDADGYRFLCEALIRDRMDEEARQFYARLPRVAAKIDPEVAFTFFRELILSDLLDREKYGDAAAELRRFAAQVKSPGARAAAELEQGRLQLDCLGDAAAAGRAFDAVKAASFKDRDKDARAYRLLAADLALYREGLAAARRQYALVDPAVKALDERQKMQLGGVLLNIRNCLVLKKYADALEYLDRLEDKMPEMRLRPDVNLLRGRALLHHDRPRRAETVLQRVLLLEPDPGTAASAALELAGLCRRDGRRLQAVTWLKRAIREAPQSRQAAAAVRMLDELKEEK